MTNIERVTPKGIEEQISQRRKSEIKFGGGEKIEVVQINPNEIDEIKRIRGHVSLFCPETLEGGGAEIATGPIFTPVSSDAKIPEGSWALIPKR